MTCAACGRTLTADEVAVTKKLVNRGAASFYCVDCLAAYFAVTPADIRERIAYFRAAGCTLFTAEEQTKTEHVQPKPTARTL